MKAIIKKSLIPIVFVIIVFPTLITYSVKKNNDVTQEDYDQELHGLILSISSADKGSYKIVVKQHNNRSDSVYFLGLGYKSDDVLVNDSISKNRKDTKYYIYRKKDNNYYLNYTEELRGKFFEKWN